MVASFLLGSRRRLFSSASHLRLGALRESTVDRLPHSFLLRLDPREFALGFGDFLRLASRVLAKLAGDAGAVRADLGVLRVAPRANLGVAAVREREPAELDFGVGVDRDEPQSRSGVHVGVGGKLLEAKRAGVERLERGGAHVAAANLLNLELGALQTDRGDGGVERSASSKGRGGLPSQLGELPRELCVSRALGLSLTLERVEGAEDVVAPGVKEDRGSRRARVGRHPGKVRVAQSRGVESGGGFHNTGPRREAFISTPDGSID